MKLKFKLVALLFLVACSSYEDKSYEGLIIQEEKPDKSTYLVRQNLLQLQQVYDLNYFQYSSEVTVTSDKLPHQRPRSEVTIGATPNEGPHTSLRNWLHEEFHLWAILQDKKLDPLMDDLKKMFPRVSQEDHLHLVICYLEFEALSFYLSDKEVRKVLGPLSWSYGQVVNRRKVFKRMLLKHQLLPFILR